MIMVLIAAGVALVVSLVFTPQLIRIFTQQGFGQEIREDGPPTHQTKRGTPSMGGVAILVGMWGGYLVAQLGGVLIYHYRPGPSASGLLVLGLATTLGVVGFIDDFIKIRQARNLGLNKTAKTCGQVGAGILFGLLALRFPNHVGLTPASQHLSYLRDITILTFPPVIFLLFCVLLTSAWSNAVNVTDGLDGLAGGAMAMVGTGYVFITLQQHRNSCVFTPELGCYQIRDPLDLALVAAAVVGACVGFLWWNAPPAQIFMGDTGSLALGGIITGLSMTTRTELLAVLLGGLFVAEISSVVIQIFTFRVLGRRFFRMAPFHHHFELGGWAETTVIIRFWLITAICCGLGLSIFYSDWLSAVGN